MTFVSMQDYAALRSYAEDQLRIHGLAEQGWTFAWSDRKRAWGDCCSKKKQIRISRHLLSCGESVESMQVTVRHEIAHALVGPKHGHDRVWKLKAIELGVPPEACRGSRTEGFEQKGHTWFRICDCCGEKTGYFRKPSGRYRRSCAKCHPGAFSAKYLLRVVRACELEAVS